MGQAGENAGRRRRAQAHMYLITRRFKNVKNSKIKLRKSKSSIKHLYRYYNIIKQIGTTCVEFT